MKKKNQVMDEGHVQKGRRTSVKEINEIWEVSLSDKMR